ncbi:MAG: transporter substrate-binding domain-containing protein [Kordiimonadaceae bacterium]|nr:transporter substrate-binding domain-containing protein [Kordiimonadaceae bacterium]
MGQHLLRSFWACITMLVIGLMMLFPLQANADSATTTIPPISILYMDAPGFSHAWKEILSNAGIIVDKVYVRHTSPYRKMFIEGKITLECCMSELWRQRPEEIPLQLFSDAFYVSEERYIFRKGETIPITDTKQLYDMRFATVRGFSYAFELGNPINVDNIAQVLTAIATGQADIGLMNKSLFLNMMKQAPQNLELGGINAKIGLQIRIHKSRADLLPQINAAIARLQATGRLKMLVESGN